MSNHTNLTVREADDDGDGLTDEAVLHYQKLPEEEKKKSRAARGPLPGQGAAYAGAAGLGMASVAFDDRQLHADLSGAPAADDPWGAEDDEYAVPGAVTGAEDEARDKRRQGGPGMALRGSGTRGGSRAGNGPMAGGAPMMGAPGATVGGVGGQAAAPVAGLSPQLGMAQSNAAGSMPVGLLQGAQNTNRAATSAVYAPPMGGGGLQAASAGPGAYDPEVLREALKANGFMPEEEATGPGVRPGSGSELVDTDGDGIPDTPRSEAERARREQGQQPGGPNFIPLPGGGGGGNQLGPGGSGGPGSYYGPGGPGSNGPGTGGYQPPRGPGYPVPTTPVPTNPGGPTGPTNPGYPPSTSGPGTQTGPGQNGGWQPPTSTGPIAADGAQQGTMSDGSFAQATPTYTGSGGSGYSVTPDDLRRESRDWAAVAEQSQPIARAIISTPPPDRMFGHMSAPIATYKEAVATAQDHVDQSGEQSMTVAESLNETASNFDEQELAAIAETGRMI